MNFDTNYIKRVWCISDIHFGVRANSLEWLKLQKNYFYEFFIPLVKKEYKPGDVLFVIGDIFDNRQSIQILVQNTVIDLFEDLSEIFKQIHIITGNHDIYRKESNEITSLKCLKNIKNVKIYKDTEMLDINGKSVLMMPWQKSPEAEIDTLERFKGASYLFCHSEVQGIKLNKKSIQQHGVNASAYQFYNKVYSGHIHYAQKKKNIRYIGNPFEMTRADMYNKKGIFLLDIQSFKETYFPNNYSPHFIKMNLKYLYEMTISELRNKIENNFVDLYVAGQDAIKYNFSKLMDMLENHAILVEPYIYDDTEEGNLEDIDSDDYSNFNILKIANKHLDKSSYEKNMKDKIEFKIKELYEEVINKTK